MDPIEVAIVSGKGGTGKTVFASSLAKIAERVAIADCDVDAPNMHILLNPTTKIEGPFFGDRKAVLDSDSCTRCGECFRTCRFGAVTERDIGDEWAYSIDPLSCEGCSACTRVCPEKSLQMMELSAGTWFVSDTPLGPLIHATLAAAQRNSADLVRIVRREARNTAHREGLRHIVIDGPAGIGSPVIATIEGVLLAVVITEPTVSGIHDLRRITGLTARLGTRTVGIINKYDINRDVADQIEDYLATRDIPLIGRIPVSSEVNKAATEGTFAVDAVGDPAADEMRKTAGRIIELLDMEYRDGH